MLVCQQCLGWPKELWIQIKEAAAGLGTLGGSAVWVDE